MTWVLVLFFFSPKGVAVTNIPDFTNEAECKKAGEISANAIANEHWKHVRFACMKQTKENK